MNIDISNAHCGPRIQFPDHAWLRVVLISIYCLRRAADGHIGAGVRAIVGRSPGCAMTHDTRCVLLRRGSLSRARSSSSRDEMREKNSESVTPVRACHPWASSEMTRRGVMTESVEGGILEVVVGERTSSYPRFVVRSGERELSLKPRKAPS